MTDISQALRELLLARASGQIDGEEFERRQAALHAELLAPAEMSATPAVAASAVPSAMPLPTVASTNTWWPWALGLIVVGAVIGLYSWVGSPGTVSTAPTLPPMPAKKPFGSEVGPLSSSGTGGDLKLMAGRLAEKLNKDPGNGEGWALLAQTYMELRQHKEAAAAFAKADAAAPLDAKALAEWTDAHVVSSGRKWDAKAKELLARALAADPKNLKALALAGSEAFERGDYKGAIASWKKMKATAPAGSMDAKLADANIEEATAVMSGKRPVAAGKTE